MSDRKISEIMKELTNYETWLTYFEDEEVKIQCVRFLPPPPNNEFLLQARAIEMLPLEDSTIYNYIRSYVATKVFHLKKELKRALKDA